MKYGKLIIEKREYERLKRILIIGSDSNDNEQKNAIRKLVNELKSAEIKKGIDMPEDVIRLNSTVVFKMPDMKIRKFKIVLPAESDVSEKRLSLLSPMGLALFGYANGDTVEWQFPSGVNRIAIIEVEQEKKIFFMTQFNEFTNQTMVLNIEHVFVERDLRHLKEELTITAVEMKFCRNLFTSIVNEGKSLQLTKYENILKALENLENENEKFEAQLLSISIQFTGFAECQDVQCDNFYISNYLDFRETVEQHFYHYRELKKKLLSRMNSVTFSK